MAERRGLAQCDATIAAACRVQSEGSKWRTARCPPTGGGLCPPMGGQGRTASARTTSANIPPRPSTHPNLGALRGGGVTSGLFRWGDRRTSSARGMIGRTTSASLVSLRGRRAQHEYEPVHTPRRGGEDAPARVRQLDASRTLDPMPSRSHHSPLAQRGRSPAGALAFACAFHMSRVAAPPASRPQR